MTKNRPGPAVGSSEAPRVHLIDRPSNNKPASPLQAPSKKPIHAAQSTYDALLWTLREYGAERLQHGPTLNRLSELSTVQLSQLIRSLESLQSQYGPTITPALLHQLKDYADVE